MDRWDIEKRIAIECVKNQEFKRKFLEHPKATALEFLKSLKGFNASALRNARFTVYEEREQELLVSIPFVKNGSSITEKELKRLAAGGGGPEVGVL